MAGLNDLYQEILLEHNSKPHNFRSMEDATQSAEGFNPLCGDMITVFLQVADGVSYATGSHFHCTTGNTCALTPCSTKNDRTRTASSDAKRSLAQTSRTVSNLS
mgnify:CR=1 FL=1